MRYLAALDCDMVRSGDVIFCCVYIVRFKKGGFGYEAIFFSPPFRRQ